MHTPVNDVRTQGLSHLKWQELQRRYCGGDSTANVVVPTISFSRFNRNPPKLTNLVLLSDPEGAVPCIVLQIHVG